METLRFLAAATRRQELSPWLPASRTASYLPRQKEKFHLLLPSGTDRCVAYERGFTSAVSSPSVSSRILCSPTKSSLSTGLLAPRHATLCSTAVQLTKETSVSLYRYNRAPVTDRVVFNAQQTAALSTTSTASTPAPPSPSSAGTLRNGPTGDDENSDEDSARLRSKLDELVNNTAIVLFMKGSPQEPQCGFSARAVALLEASDIEDYTFINILKYPDIRSLAKKHFRWPTYPLLIVGGEVVGGVDIMEELSKTGELKQMMQSAVEKYTKTQSN